MLNILIEDETVIEHGSLAADLMSMNHIANTMTSSDVKRLQKNLQMQSPSKPLKHSLDRPARIAA